MDSCAVVEFDHVSKIYASLFSRRRVVALREVSFSVHAGEVFGLVGPNRAGKTTLLKILLSACRPTHGGAYRFGRLVADKSTLARVGYMHENQAFPAYLTAEGLLKYYGALTLLPAATIRHRSAELLVRVGLGDRRREPIAQFSKGMVQRLALAQALLNEPDLLVLDEPTEGLDQFGRKLIHEVVSRQRKAGRTTLLVSHHLPDVARLCDRVAVIRNGSLLHLGPIGELTAATVDEASESLESALLDFYAGASA